MFILLVLKLDSTVMAEKNLGCTKPSLSPPPPHLSYLMTSSYTFEPPLTDTQSRFQPNTKQLHFQPLHSGHWNVVPRVCAYGRFVGGGGGRGEGEPEHARYGKWNVYTPSAPPPQPPPQTSRSVPDGACVLVQRELNAYEN